MKSVCCDSLNTSFRVQTSSSPKRIVTPSRFQSRRLVLRALPMRLIRNYTKNSRQLNRCLRSLLLAAAFAAPAAVIASPLPQDANSRMILARERVAPATIQRRAFSVTLFTAPSMQFGATANTAGHINWTPAGTNAPSQNINALIAMENVRTVFSTESRFPLVQFYSGRLHLDAFQNTLHLQSVQSGPSALRSIHFSGLSLGFHPGEEARTAHPLPAWRRFSQIVGTALD
jgi:hypothetical protein